MTIGVDLPVISAVLLAAGLLCLLGACAPRRRLLSIAVLILGALAVSTGTAAAVPGPVLKPVAPQVATAASAAQKAQPQQSASSHSSSTAASLGHASGAVGNSAASSLAHQVTQQIQQSLNHPVSDPLPNNRTGSTAAAGSSQDSGRHSTSSNSNNSQSNGSGQNNTFTPKPHRIQLNNSGTQPGSQRLPSSLINISPFTGKNNNTSAFDWSLLNKNNKNAATAFQSPENKGGSNGGPSGGSGFSAGRPLVTSGGTTALTGFANGNLLDTNWLDQPTITNYNDNTSSNSSQSQSTATQPGNLLLGSDPWSTIFKPGQSNGFALPQTYVFPQGTGSNVTTTTTDPSGKQVTGKLIPTGQIDGTGQLKGTGLTIWNLKQLQNEQQGQQTGQLQIPLLQNLDKCLLNASASGCTPTPVPVRSPIQFNPPVPVKRSTPNLKLPVQPKLPATASSTVCPLVTSIVVTSCLPLPGQNPGTRQTQPVCYLVTADPVEAQAQYSTFAAGNAAANAANRMASVLARNAGRPLTAQQVADMIKAGILRPGDIASVLAQTQPATSTHCDSVSKGSSNVYASKKGKGGNSGKGRLSKSYRQIADAFNATVAAVRDAIHAAKRYGYFGGARSNPDVVIDLDTGEMYVDLGNGQTSDDSIGNIRDYLP